MNSRFHPLKKRQFKAFVATAAFCLSCLPVWSETSATVTVNASSVSYPVPPEGYGLCTYVWDSNMLSSGVAAEVKASGINALRYPTGSTSDVFNFISGTQASMNDGAGWDLELCEALRIPEGVLPKLVSSTGVIGEAAALEGAPLIAGIAGDQQASLVGQGCLGPGSAKATFGTGGMLDCCVGPRRPDFAQRGAAGTFPIVAWSGGGELTWGLEAVMLSAGSCVEWLRDDLGIVDTAADTDAMAASVPDAGGVYFVPALLGLGTPVWDFGARGTLVGITRGTTRNEIVRAVLEGIAQRGADLLEAVVADSGLDVEVLKVDGGMSANSTFIQALADATRRRIEVAPVTEATTLGAAFLAGTATGVWSSLAEASALVHPRVVVEPARRLDRARWLEARSRAERTVPELSALDF